MTFASEAEMSFGSNPLGVTETPYTVHIPLVTVFNLSDPL
jgi:hypothetical protein